VARRDRASASRVTITSSNHPPYLLILSQQLDKTVRTRTERKRVCRVSGSLLPPRIHGMIRAFSELAVENVAKAMSALNESTSEPARPISFAFTAVRALFLHGGARDERHIERRHRSAASELAARPDTCSHAGGGEKSTVVISTLRDARR